MCRLLLCVLCAVLCTKPCSLRYKHADSACIYNSITGSLKRAGFEEQSSNAAKERTQWNVRWGKHMLPDAFKEIKSYQKINHFPVRTLALGGGAAAAAAAVAAACWPVADFLSLLLVLCFVLFSLLAPSLAVPCFVVLCCAVL